MTEDWLGMSWVVAERPTNPVDMGVSVDPVSGTVVLWSLDDNNVAHIELLSMYADTEEG